MADGKEGGEDAHHFFDVLGGRAHPVARGLPGTLSVRRPVLVAGWPRAALVAELQE